MEVFVDKFTLRTGQDQGRCLSWAFLVVDIFDLGKQDQIALYQLLLSLLSVVDF